MKIINLACKNFSEAKKISISLLRKKVVICVNIFPQVNSQYLWQNKIEQAKEVIIIAKTLPRLIKKAILIIKKIIPINYLIFRFGIVM